MTVIRSLKSVSLAAVSVCGLLLPAGCTDYARRSADAQVYKLLEDRKKTALGYDPQAVSEPVKPGEHPDAPEARQGDSSTTRPSVTERNARIEKSKATPVASSAYERIPQSPVPPLEPPVLEVPPAIAPFLPLGPFQGEDAEAPPVKMDPFASDMATRWIENRLIYGPTPPRPRPVEMDLFAALREGVSHSRTYRNQMDDLYLAALDVTLQRHLLSPRPFAGADLTYSGGQLASNYDSALTATMNAGVRQRLPYGGEIVAQALVGFVNALNDNVNDGETASLVLSGSVPLLRGAGLVNLEDLIASERELVYQVRTFEEYRRTFAIDVANQYFRLLASYQSINNRRTNLQNSVSLLERTRALYAADLGAAGRVGNGALKLTFLEVQRSEQQLLDAQDSLVSAQEEYLNALDDFKLLLGLEIGKDVDIIPVDLELHIPDLDERDLYALASKYRLDLQTARDRIDDARRAVAIAENGLLPDLNLTAKSELGNRDELARRLDSRNLTYSAGLSLDLPLDRLAERNAYRRSLILFHRSQRTFEDLSDRVEADVRSSVRAIRSSQVSVAIQKRSIELSQRRLEYANMLLKRGQTNARDVVEAQSALIRAQDLYERARADLQVQVLQFLRLTGTMRIDPGSGSIGQALDRSKGEWVAPGVGPGQQSVMNIPQPPGY